jgi:hypothetical protein
MKITSTQWIELIKLLATFVIGVISVLAVQSCTASMSIFWKNANSTQRSEQSQSTIVDSTSVNFKTY